MPPMRPTPAAQPAPEPRVPRVGLGGVAVEDAPGAEVEKGHEGTPQQYLRPGCVRSQPPEAEEEGRDGAAQQVRNQGRFAAPLLDEVGGGEVAGDLGERNEQHEAERAGDLVAGGHQDLGQPREDAIVREHHPEPQHPQHRRPPGVPPGPQHPEPRSRTNVPGLAGPLLVIRPVAELDPERCRGLARFVYASLAQEVAGDSGRLRRRTST